MGGVIYSLYLIISALNVKHGALAAIHSNSKILYQARMWAQILAFTSESIICYTPMESMGSVFHGMNDEYSCHGPGTSTP